MKKKEKTIKAFEELAHKYRNPKGKKFFQGNSCPLCLILEEKDPSCRGCPLADEFEDDGCTEFESYQNAQIKHHNTEHVFENGHGCPEFIKRAEFFEKYLPVIKKWPASRFTKKGWKYSGDDISRED